MGAYMTSKLMIKYKRKTNEELFAYLEAYKASGKINDIQYEELLDMIE